jgi:polyisoprenoid-binding protein YceI
MKLALVALGVLVVVIIGFVTWSPANTPTDNPVETQVTETRDNTTEATDSSETASAEKSSPSVGDYTLNTGASLVSWAGQKPLIDGYINSGSLAVADGSVRVTDETITGSFTIDMNTLSVSDTPTKPGSESALEGHLKGERWFDVGNHPEATFVITEVTPRPDVADTFTYDVTGELTMKGVTESLTFPAEIYQATDGLVYAEASLEFDRTLWGITAGSGSFFDNLADNVVSDMVSLSFTLVAEPQS